MSVEGDNSGVLISIIICTHNRAKYLRRTLDSIASVCVSDTLPTELLVVDNASTDDTAAVVQQCRLPNMPVRYILEPQRGKGYAYNRGMAEAEGEVFLFTDDDVRLPNNWIEGMCGPILAGRAQAVVGGIQIPEHLKRPWMEPLHRAWMASTEGLDALDPPALVGANMAFSVNVLTKVPGFDPELGPGALGFCDETLFSLQLKKAGYKIASAYEVEVEHHFDPARLTRASFLSRAIGEGRSQAYFVYHWQHEAIPNAKLSLLKRSLRLWCSRIAHYLECLSPEGMPVWEMNVVRDIAFYRQTLVEQQKIHNYEQYGLVKYGERKDAAGI